VVDRPCSLPEHRQEPASCPRRFYAADQLHAAAGEVILLNIYQYQCGTYVSSSYVFDAMGIRLRTIFQPEASCCRKRES
jgi:hypothetical protein